MKATIVQKLLIAAKEYGIGSLHEIYPTTMISNTLVDTPKTIVYLGVTKESMVIEFNDGSRLRVINSQRFTDGLKYEASIDGKGLIDVRRLRTQDSASGASRQDRVRHPCACGSTRRTRNVDTLLGSTCRW